MSNNADNITLRVGTRADAPQIAQLIMMAMTPECCLHFCGEGHALDEFERLMTELVEREDTQYSHLNTICAVDGDGRVAGVCVSYDGADLLRLRQPFVDGALRAFGIDHSGMAQETAAGELYADSLAVLPQYRGQGIASRLLKATAEKARRAGAGPLGLLVDEANPKAERLYLSLGFRQVGSNTWGGHRMKHMQMV